MKHLFIICILLMVISNTRDKFQDHSETRTEQKEKHQKQEQQAEESDEIQDDPFIDNYGNGTTFNVGIKKP